MNQYTIYCTEEQTKSEICEHACKEQHKIDIQEALEAFCKICNCKECSKRNVTCSEYKEFEKLLKS